MWTVVALVLSVAYLAASEFPLGLAPHRSRHGLMCAGYSMAEAFCTAHNCEKASEGFCTVDVCEVIEVSTLRLLPTC